MEKEMKRRENEVEERENSILMELATMKEAMAEKDAKIENLNSDLMEVKELEFLSLVLNLNSSHET